MDPFAATSDQQQQAQQGGNNEGQTWWFKWLIKGAAVVLGFIALLMGILTAISISPICIAAGFLLAFSGIVVLALEVPICFSFVEVLKPLTRFSEGRPHWQKVAIYMTLPIVVILMCATAASILGSLCVFGVAALYFMLTVGKKASLDEMRNRATAESKANLATNELPR